MLNLRVKLFLDRFEVDIHLNVVVEGSKVI